MILIIFNCSFSIENYGKFHIIYKIKGLIGTVVNQANMEGQLKIQRQFNLWGGASFCHNPPCMSRFWIGMMRIISRLRNRHIVELVDTQVRDYARIFTHPPFIFNYLINRQQINFHFPSANKSELFS